MKVGVVIMLALGISGCQSIEVRGQFINDEAIEEINAKKPSSDEVLRLLGSPTYVPEYSPNNWYYIQRSIAKRAWFEPKVVEQRVVKIEFNTQGKTDKAVLLASEHIENLQVDNQYTKSVGTEKNQLQKFVKNIGRFNKTTNNNKKRQKKKK